MQDVYLTVASDFNDPGTDRLYRALLGSLDLGEQVSSRGPSPTARRVVIPPQRSGYLAQIADTVHQYNRLAEGQTEAARRLYQLEGSRALLEETDPHGPASEALAEAIAATAGQLLPEHREALRNWGDTEAAYRREQYSYLVRGRQIEVSLWSPTLSETRLPKVALPRYRGLGAIG